MSNQYDRVSYPDKVQFASELEDDHDGVGHRTGNGVYNDYTVQLAPKQYSESFKIACFRIEKTKRTAFIVCGILVVLVMIIIIAVTVHHTTKNKGTPRKEFGLLAYPHATDGSSVISFDPSSYDSYKQYIELLVHHMNDYDVVKQESQLDKYRVCSSNRTGESLPEGQVCMQMPITFGTFCQHMNLFGYESEEPCVLLILKLEKGVKPAAYDLNKVNDQRLKNELLDSVEKGLIPVRCEGKTEEDRNNMMITDLATGGKTIEIQYHPLGFPLYFFPVKSDSHYINPAVMVQFRSVKMGVDVTIKCTAWVNSNATESPQDAGSIFSSEFTFNMAHKP